MLTKKVMKELYSMSLYTDVPENSQVYGLQCSFSNDDQTISLETKQDALQQNNATLILVVYG